MVRTFTLILLSAAALAGLAYLALCCLDPQRQAAGPVIEQPSSPSAAPAGDSADPPLESADPPVSTEPTEVAPKPREIRGVVLDRTGEIPITNARVKVVLYTPRGERNYALVNVFKKMLDVDEKGRFSLQVPGGGWYRVAAEAEGFAPVRMEKVRPGSDITLYMDMGAGLAGVVYMKDTKTPLADVKVTAIAAEGDFKREARTDEKGRFHLADLPAGTLTLLFVHPDHVPLAGVEQEIIVGARQEMVVELDPGKLIKGDVRSRRDDLPVAGARIKAGLKEVRTDESGHFEMRGVPAKLVRLEVTARGYLLHQRNVNLSGSREEAEVLISLEKGAEIYGTVHDEEGKPIVGAEIKLYNSYGNGEWMYVAWEYRYMKVKTDEEGRYVLSGIKPAKWNTYAVGARLEGHPASYARDIKILNEDDRIAADILVERGGLVEGRVTDMDGNPIAGARVVLNSESSWDWSARQQNPVVGTGPDGIFVFRGVSEGSYSIYVDARGYSTAWKGDIKIIGTSESRGIELTLHKGRPLEGVVLDREDQPLAGVLVRVRSKGAEGKAVSDGEGKFTIPSIPEGPYRVTARLEGYAGFSRWNVSPDSDGLLRLHLARQPVVKGRVVDDATGKPLRSYRVQLIKMEQTRSTYSWPTTQLWVNDKEGRFSLQAPVGEYRLEVFANGRVRYRKDNLSLDLENEVPEMEIRMRKGGAIEGYVRDSGGAPLRGVSVYLRGTDDESPVYFMKTSTEHDGYFFVGDLDAGDYDVLIKGSGYPLWAREGVRVGGSLPSRIDVDLERFATVVVRARWKKNDKKGGKKGQGLGTATENVVVYRSDGSFRNAWNSRRRSKRMRIVLEALENQKVGIQYKGFSAGEGNSFLLTTKRSLMLRNGYSGTFTDLPVGPYRVTAKAPGYPERVFYVNLDYGLTTNLDLVFEPEKPEKETASVPGGDQR